MSELDRRLREASDAVATMDPPADLWARVVERADDGDAVLRDRTDLRHRSRPMLWLAVAAATVVLALVAGALALLDDDRDDDTVDTVDDPTVDTAPVTEAPPQGAAPGTIVSGAGCPFGITGDPIAMTPGPVDPLGPRFDGEPGQGIAHAVLGEQVVEVRVPGFVLTDESGWRIEDIELGRGPARLWLDGPASGERNLPFVQVFSHPAGEEPCGSFTVTVDGGTEDANRRVAVDIADRLVLSSELADLDLPGAEGGPVAGLELDGSEWRVVGTATGPTSGELTVSFTATTVTWGNGCATVTADYVLDRADGVLILTNPTSTSPGCTPPTDRAGFYPGRAIDAVMGMGRITARYVFGFPGGDPAEVEGTVLYLGDHPMGTHVALTPA